MAKINLLPRKEFEIALDDNTVIKGQFGTWALKRMCDKLKCKLYELQSKFEQKNEKGDLVPVDIEVYLEFLLSAVEQKARQDKAPFSYTDVDAGMWIDQLGGRMSKNMADIFDHSTDKVEQKKTESQEMEPVS
jgi:hypothetical protein